MSFLRGEGSAVLSCRQCCFGLYVIIRTQWRYFIPHVSTLSLFCVVFLSGRIVFQTLTIIQLRFVKAEATAALLCFTKSLLTVTAILKEGIRFPSNCQVISFICVLFSILFTIIPGPLLLYKFTFNNQYLYSVKH